MYDIEVYADRFEQEQAYRLECNAESEQEEALERAVQVPEILKQAVETPTLSAQTLEETAMFEEWLS